MLRLIGVLLCVCLLVLPLSLAVAAQRGSSALEQQCFTALPESVTPTTPPPITSAASYAVFDPVSGDFIVEGDANTRRPMASTTKIMTALVVLEHCDLTATVTVPAEAVGVEGSSIYLYKGERITVRDLLYGLMLSSANDAATALAIYTAGSEANFVALMNEKAASLGLSNTHFCNPHGLHHAEHYTTARDLASLAAAALEHPVFADIVATKRYSALQKDTEASRLFLNHNRLLRQLEGTIGVKTGYTKAGGRCLVSAARRNGLTLIAVTLNDPTDWKDHTALLEWGFSQYTSFAPTVEPLTLPVVGGTQKNANLIPVGGLSVTLPAQHPAVTCTVEAPRFLYAGIAANAQVGRVIYRMGDRILGEIPLVTGTAIPREPSPTLWDKFKNLFAK